MFIANALGSAGWLVLLYYLARSFDSVGLVKTYLHDGEVAFTIFILTALAIYFTLSFIMSTVFKLNSKK